MRIAGDIVIGIGIAAILFGVIGIIKYQDFYKRILMTAKIDTVGVITIIIGLAVKHGFSFFSLKVLLLMVIWMIVSPLATHMIARSAYLSGYRTQKTGDDGGHL